MAGSQSHLIPTTHLLHFWERPPLSSAQLRARIPQAASHDYQSKAGKIPNMPLCSAGTGLRSQGDTFGSWARHSLTRTTGSTPQGGQTLVNDQVVILRNNMEDQSQDHQNSEKKETCRQGAMGVWGSYK